jgi:transcription-repair coupling factor (superfamily II helicase)
LFIQNTEDFFRSWISNLEGRRSFKAINWHQTCHAGSTVFKPKDFYKKSFRFSIVELSPTPILNRQEIWISHSATTSFNKQFDLLLNNLSENQFNGYKIICFEWGTSQTFSWYFESLDESTREYSQTI